MKEFFIDNLLAKVIAVFFAIILWAMVKGSDQGVSTLSIPLTFIDVPAEKSVISSANFVEVRLAGPRSLLSSNVLRQSRVEISVANAPLSQEQNITIEPSMVRVPFGLEVQSIRPSILEYRIEKVVAVLATITPTLIGTLSEEFDLERVTIKPQEITLAVPATEVANYKVVKTTPIDISTLKDSAVISTSIMIPSSISFSEQEITVAIDIKEKSLQRTLTQVPVITEKAFLPSPPFIKVTVEGRHSVVSAINPFALEAKVDTSGTVESIRGLENISAKIIAIEPRQIVLIDNESE
ncbi:CdaR family protein [Chrysiogenes arsenatis]|uniref:CdaR family protein n=1 Tax=Chrysiogenes arsenatis TaxID=309797 RepID=UPI000409E053|nr:CdaR family protein [Chrysiogenes arsenatis]